MKRLYAITILSMLSLTACKTTLSDQDRAMLNEINKTAVDARAVATSAAEEARRASEAAERAAAAAEAASMKSDRIFKASQKK